MGVSDEVSETCVYSGDSATRASVWTIAAAHYIIDGVEGGFDAHLLFCFGPESFPLQWQLRRK
jgi:hypothetical protein